jgi:RNA-directed DNA polymerase
MSDTTEPKPEAVPARATRAGAVLLRWGWVEPTVWTERMLTALDEGVQGGRWYSLMDKVHPERNLSAAFLQVAANQGAAGVDHVTVKMFEERLDANLQDLDDTLRTGTYRPQAIRRHYIPKPGSRERRPLGIPTVRDRVVQTALRQVLEPIFERDFATHSYGFRPGRGCKDALRRVDELLKAGYTHVVDADLKSYFDTIPHDRWSALVCKKVSDGRVLNLIEAFRNQGVLDGLEEWTPEQGTPQGAVVTPPTMLRTTLLGASFKRGWTDPIDHVDFTFIDLNLLD